MNQRRKKQTWYSQGGSAINETTPLGGTTGGRTLDDPIKFPFSNMDAVGDLGRQGSTSDKYQNRLDGTNPGKRWNYAYGPNEFGSTAINQEWNSGGDLGP